MTYHQVDILHHTPIVKLHAGAKEPVDVGLHLNRPRQDAIGEFIVDCGMLAKQSKIKVFLSEIFQIYLWFQTQVDFKYLLATSH